MATYRDLESSALVRARCPLIAEVAGHVGDAQVRNKGTIGGSLAHADPAADLPAAILALDAELQVRGPEGGRTVSAANFFVGLMQTAIAPGEILCGIRIAATGRSVAYVKTEQKASGFALCGVAAVIDAHGSARIGITGVASVAYRAHAAEQALAGQPLTDVHVDEAAAHAADGVELLSDIHAPAEYRAHLAAVNTRRALLRARG
jgi:carbon-monoxide dehydrogenase medium subunit